MPYQVYSPSEWAAAWAEINPRTVGKSMPLLEYCRLCDRVKAGWQMSPESASNRRYAVHLNDCLQRGLAVPEEYLRTLLPERDLAFDWNYFPVLRARLRELGIPEPAQWAVTEARLAASR